MPVKFEVLTLFPRMFEGFAAESIIGRAAGEGIIRIKATNIRDFAQGRHKVADDYSFGGGCGMVMMAEPIARAIEHVIGSEPEDETTRILMTSPQGRRFEQADARRLSKYGRIVIICGHYEGVDERVSSLVDEEVSIGDFVLTGGEIPAMAVIDAISRMIPGVLGHEQSAQTDSFSDGLLDYPHYTRPRIWRGMHAPEVLLSGDHEKIRTFRRAQSLKRTAERRPDLIASLDLSEEDIRLLNDLPKAKRPRRKSAVKDENGK